MDESLSTRLQGRDNNFNLLRMLAASMVLVSHSFPLATGKTDAEPWRAVLGATPGSIAVEVFFIVSGLLLTHSLLTRRTTWGFVQSRVLRIYPGLWVAMFLTVLVLGAWVTTLDLWTYYSSKQTWRHLVMNWLALPPAEFVLPGVFVDNPYPQAVNGSIWTLRYELMAYLVLLGLWVLAAMVSTRRFGKAVILVVCALLLAWFTTELRSPRYALPTATAVLGLAALALVGRKHFFESFCVVIFVSVLAWRFTELGREALEESHLRLFWAFFAGSALCVFARHVPLNRTLMALGVLALGVGVYRPAWFPWVYTLALPYVVVWLAYVPAGLVREYNRLGDYSYGVYVYAFPVQQLVAHLMPGVGVWALAGWSMLGTLALAVLSWHLIEKPASKLRVLPARWTKPDAQATATRPPGTERSLA